MARCELLTTWGISTTGIFCMWHCDITTFYVSFSTTTFFFYFLLWHLWKKRMICFFGVVFWLYLFYFLISFYMYDNISLGDLRTWTKTRYTEFCRPFLSFCPFFDAFCCSFVWIYAVMPCFFLFLLFLLFWSCAWKDCTNGLCFLFCFALLFLARRHALIRDAPDDLYFSPPCFFLFAT